MPKFLVGKISDVTEGKVISKITPYGPVGITRLDGQILAFQDECTHDGAPFDDAMVDVKSKEIICPRHGARFSLLTGEVKKLPATENIEIYNIEIIDDDIYVDID